jgi:membrane associated rhomboid family serine protease
MLEDRDYMRQPSGGLNWSATVTLVVTLFIAFILQITVLPRLIPPEYLVLSLEGLRRGYVWQLLSFQFLHAGWLHLLFNLLAIYFFGRSVEFAMGRRRWLILYFLSGIVGGLVQMLLALLVPSHFDAPVVGASAGAAGLVAAFSLLNWQQSFTLLFYFVPVRMRGRTLAVCWRATPTSVGAPWPGPACGAGARFIRNHADANWSERLPSEPPPGREPAPNGRPNRPRRNSSAAKSIPSWTRSPRTAFRA